MAKIYYVGDWAVLTGPVFAETPFYHSPKGLDIFNYGKWLKDALESTGEHEVESVPAWDFYNKLGPGDYERVLEAFDVLVFSDIDAKLFQLAPNFFDRNKFGSAILTYPDRIRLTVEAVKEGKAAGIPSPASWARAAGAGPASGRSSPSAASIMRTSWRAPRASTPNSRRPGNDSSNP